VGPWATLTWATLALSLPHHGSGGKVGPCDTLGVTTAPNPQAEIQTIVTADTAKRTILLIEKTFMFCSFFSLNFPHLRTDRQAFLVVIQTQVVYLSCQPKQFLHPKFSVFRVLTEKNLAEI
jgi:hypothetical protein